MPFDLAALWLLALASAIGAGCFYAGWRAAAAYLNAAKAVSEISGVAVQQANSFARSLDSSRETLSSLERAVAKNTEVMDARQRALEDALLTLFQGLERAGLARSGTTRTLARQVGEPPSPE